MTDADALLAAIRAAPDDDAPRLIYADWLDEHGQPERAEFIRVQCELARRDDRTLRRREAELLDEYHEILAGPLAARYLRFRFARGFIVGFGHSGRFVSGPLPFEAGGILSYEFRLDGSSEFDMVTAMRRRFNFRGTYNVDPFESQSRLLIESAFEGSPQHQRGVLEQSRYSFETPNESAVRQRQIDLLFGRPPSRDRSADRTIRIELALVPDIDSFPET